MRELIYLNGRQQPRSEARLLVGDRGLTVGQGAFETLRCYGGKPFGLDEHLARLWRTLAALGLSIDESPAQLGEAARALVAEGGSGEGDCRLRITITAGPPEGPATRLIECQPLGAPKAEDYARGIAAVTVCWPNGPGPLAGHKVTSFAANLQARRAATRVGAREALIVAPEPVLVEGAMSNLFLVAGGAVFTPPLSDGPLPGITRRAVLDLLTAGGIAGGERRLDRSDLAGAEELFVTSSIAELLPVTRVDGAPVGGAAVGPVTKALASNYRDMTRS